MSADRRQALPVTCTTAGEGFPLLLLPGADGTATVWEQYVPLLSELCRTITYSVPATVSHDITLIQALSTGLALERLYLACQSHAWPLAVQYARHHAAHLEALLFLETEAASLHSAPLDDGALADASGHPITVPTLLLLAEQHAARPRVEALRACLSRSTGVLLAPADTVLSAAHAMMRFLVHCERQRTLVRGASFLL
ncbi:MAG: alpha/beta fold hydrolase [Candidatus Tectimicrobiota bacterium]